MSNQVGRKALGSCERQSTSAFKHSGFWQPMDTLREKIILSELWANDENMEDMGINWFLSTFQ